MKVIICSFKLIISFVKHVYKYVYIERRNNHNERASTGST